MKHRRTLQSAAVDHRRRLDCAGIETRNRAFGKILKEVEDLQLEGALRTRERRPLAAMFKFLRNNLRHQFQQRHFRRIHKPHRAE